MTSLPDVSFHLSVVVAWKPLEDSPPVLSSQLYIWTPSRGEFIGEDDGLPFSGIGWWLREQELLSTLKAEA